MSIIKNHVQLIGNMGQEPTITNLEIGKKVTRFSLATDEYYKDGQGNTQTDTNRHTIVAWRWRTGKRHEKRSRHGTDMVEVRVGTTRCMQNHRTNPSKRKNPRVATFRRLIIPTR
ncbi:single-stranded DNA-binding protein [Flavobacteriaceae bacterium MAR_2009_75]|nr:single-stranded DNA-binding protein [Flavobacteriaceae bacterium MAR_2009_75]